MKLRRNLSGIFIFDKLEGEEKPIPTCIEDCTPETRLKWLEGLEKEALIRCVEHLCDTLNEIGETFNIYKEYVLWQELLVVERSMFQLRT